MLDKRRQGAISVLLLFLFLATAYPAKAQSQPRPIGPRHGQTIQRFSNLFVNAPVVVRDSKGEPVLNLTQSNFRAYDNGAGQIMRSPWHRQCIAFRGNASDSSVRHATSNLRAVAHPGNAADAHDRGSTCRQHRRWSAGRVGVEAGECVQALECGSKPEARNRIEERVRPVVNRGDSRLIWLPTTDKTCSRSVAHDSARSLGVAPGRWLSHRSPVH